MLLSTLCLWSLVLVQVVHSHSQEPTLRKLQIIFRHGARAPDKQVWNQLDTCFPNLKLGDLTPLGRSEMKHLGFNLRIRYNSFIGANPDETEMIYSDYQRNVDTAKLLYHALFSEFNSSREIFTKIDPKVDGPMATDYDYFYASFQNLLNASEYQTLMEEITETGNTTFPITKLEHLYQVQDQIDCELANDCSLPSWLTKKIKDGVSDFIHAYYRSFMDCQHDQMVKENSDLMVQELMEHFNSSDCANSYNTYLYSSHDTNIALFLTRMSIYNGLPVPFASAVVFEQHRINHDDVIRIFYHNSSSYCSPHQLQIPGCPLDCPFNQFIQLVTQPYVCN